MRGSCPPRDASTWRCDAGVHEGDLHLQRAILRECAGKRERGESAGERETPGFMRAICTCRERFLGCVCAREREMERAQEREGFTRAIRTCRDRFLEAPAPPPQSTGPEEPGAQRTPVRTISCGATKAYPRGLPL